MKPRTGRIVGEREEREQIVFLTYKEKSGNVAWIKQFSREEAGRGLQAELQARIAYVLRLECTPKLGSNGKVVYIGRKFPKTVLKSVKRVHGTSHLKKWLRLGF